MANLPSFVKKSSYFTVFILVFLITINFVFPSVSLETQKEKNDLIIINKKNQGVLTFLHLIRNNASIINIIIVGSSFFWGLHTFNKASKWNRKKSAFEYLNNITLGEFIKIRNQLEELDINPYRKETNYFTDRRKVKTDRKKVENDRVNNNYQGKNRGNINETHLIRDILNFFNLICNDQVKKVENDRVNNNYQGNDQGNINKTHLIRDILNVFDLICTGINHGVIDEQMAFDQLHIIMFTYWEWSKPYILLARMLSVRSTKPEEYEKHKVYSDFENQVYKWKEELGETEQKDENQWKKAWKDTEMTPEKINKLEKIMPRKNPDKKLKSIREWAEEIYKEEYKEE
jgi:hypothetical protein